MREDARMGHLHERSESALRDRLGVPESATEVVVVAESTHWDPNWLVDSERYFRWCVRPTLDQVLVELRAEPRRVFSLECLFFVERYWRERPTVRTELVEFVNTGRLRFSGSGVTTPDTLLVEDEALLRDALIGQEWLCAHDMNQEPRLWYFPDSFGHSPGIPALIRALGGEYAAICRIDGMRFPGADMESPANFPRPGTSAAQLYGLGSADFVWHSGDGSSVLTHWVSQGYGQGDMIGASGLSRALGLPLAWSNRSASLVDKRIASYRDALQPLARTPYRLLPIGIDFARPVPDLVGLLDAWNERHYAATHAWLVNASLEDYLDLVSFHREGLPELRLDPNPYWMGFLATRPSIKARARDIGRHVVACDAQRADTLIHNERVEDLTPRERRARWIAATSNHHDFITGTAPDHVAWGEQDQWLTEAAAALNCAPARPMTVANVGADTSTASVVEQSGALLRVKVPWGTACFDANRGGALVSLVDRDRGELLSGPSFVLTSSFDSGGLWRMGHEFKGGRFHQMACSTERIAKLGASVFGDVVVVLVDGVVEGRRFSLEHRFSSQSPTVVTRVSYRPRQRRTVTIALRLGQVGSRLLMHQPGALVDRDLQRFYKPTFWPLHSFAVSAPEGPSAFGVAVATPTNLHFGNDGTVQVTVARSAVKEIAYRIIPVMAPAWGRSWGNHDAVLATGWIDPSHDDVVSAGRNLQRLADDAVGRPAPEFGVDVDDPDVEVVSVKPADRGTGIIVRLRNWRCDEHGRIVHLDLHGATPQVARRCDARERDVADGECPVNDQRVDIFVSHHLTSLRIVASPLR